MTRRILVVGFTILSIALQPNRLWAQWQYDGTPVATSLVSKSSPTILSDGNGGAFIAYHEVPYYPDIFLQRVNSTGKIQWTPKGVPIAVGGDYESPPKMVSDGGTGLILVWYDRRNFPNNYDIYAQRVTASGVVQWTTNGVAICTATGEQMNPAITTDGSGGAIITWQDARSGTNDIYAQRINGSGVVQWAANGVVMCNATDSQQYPLMVYDGSGGAIVGWQDNRAGNMDVYAQRVNASGVMQWAANGVNQMTGSGATLGQYLSAMTADGAGGAIMTWQDYRYGNYDVFAGRVSPAGGLLWTNFGAWLTAGGQDQLSTTMVSDGAGGAIVGWIDSGTDIFARRVDASGNPMWASEGVAVCAAAGTQNTVTMVSDGLGGVVVAWQDSRSGTVDIYAQRMDASGIAQWTPNGVPVCTAPTSQSGAVIASNNAGGAIVAWADYRSASYASDIYAQRIEREYGYWGQPEPVIATVADIKHDQGGRVSVDWTASGRDQAMPRTIGHYSVWRAVSSAAAKSELADAAKVRLDAHGPMYADLTPAADNYWELVGTQSAHGLDRYSFSADTRADSVAGAVGNESFMVLAHDQGDDYIVFPSNVVSGHSVDNLAPLAPLSLTAQRIGAYVYLKWNGVHIADLRDYSVYRRTSSGVTPVPINFLSSVNDTVLTDNSAPTSALYYIVTAYDVHANQSAPSNEASVQASTGVGNTPPITALTVLQNQPNPFAGTTDLRVGLPANSDLSIEVYDVAGRRVRTQSIAQQQAGWRSVPFNGRDDEGRPLASGVYFYRVSAGGSTVTQKMVIAR